MDRSAAPLPFSSPSWLTPSRIALTAVGAFTALATLPAVWWIDDARRELRDSRAAMTTLVVTTMVISLLLVRRALRATSTEKAVLWCVLGAIPAGVLNAGLSLAAVLFTLHGDPGQAFGGFILGSLIGGFYGAPLGLVFGSAYAIVAASALRAKSAPSHDSADRVLLVSGIWLALAAAAIQMGWTETPSLAPPLSFLAAGVACATASAARLFGRARWLRRVREGRERAFRIEPRSGAPGEDGLLPITRADADDLRGVVTHWRAPAGVPYRDMPHGVPVALADLPP